MLVRYHWNLLPSYACLCILVYQKKSPLYQGDYRNTYSAWRLRAFSHLLWYYQSTYELDTFYQCAEHYQIQCVKLAGIKLDGILALFLKCRKKQARLRIVQFSAFLSLVYLFPIYGNMYSLYHWWWNCPLLHWKGMTQFAWPPFGRFSKECTRRANRLSNIRLDITVQTELCVSLVDLSYQIIKKR